jgi:hypothetical protein
LAGRQRLLPRFARLGPPAVGTQRVQNSRSGPHSGPITLAEVCLPAIASPTRWTRWRIASSLA